MLRSKKMATRSLQLIIHLLVLKVTIAQEPSLTLLPGIIMKNLGEAVIVSCTANVPSPELISVIEWRDPNGDLIPNEDDTITTLDGLGSAKQLDLFIRKLRMEDVGVYECSATYAGNQKLTKTIKVEYYRDIDFKDTETVQTPVLNSDAKIRCLVTSDPPPLIDWLKDGVAIKGDKRFIQQNDGILIKGIKETDEGVYRCRARVQALGEIKFRDIQVEVHIPPEITGAPKDTNGVEKETVAFECIAKGKPAPVYTWVNKDSEVLNEKEGYFVDEVTGELRILDLRPDHTGLYRCTAENAAGEAFAEANLRVFTKPKVEQYLNITVADKSEAEMRCTMFGDPLPDAVFKKETIPAPFTSGANDDGRIRVEQTTDDQGNRIGILRISEVSRKDDGLYTCSGVSAGGETVVWGHITVEFEPTFEDQPQDEFWSWEQQAVNLTCLATSIPNATVQWFLREQPIREEDPNLSVLSRGPNGVLKVHPVDGSYFDKYTCRATNTLGLAEHSVDLRRVQKPGPVSSTQVEKKTATTISWAIRDPLNDGGLPVLGFTVQFRLADTSWEKSEEKFWPKGSSYVIDHLSPLAKYVFRFAARNDVGDGEWSGEKSVEMPKRSFPEEPLIFSIDPTKVKNIPYTDHYELQWQVPLDNGEPIDYFEIVYYQVHNASNGWGVVGNKEIVQVPSPGKSTYKLEGLHSNSYYKIELRAHNNIGFSTPAEAIIKTAYAPASPITDDDEPSNSGVIIAIVIIVILILLVILDVVMFFVKNVGVTALLVSKLGAGPGEKDKEAMIEEGSIKQGTQPDDNSNKEVCKISPTKEIAKEKECSETTPMITGETDKDAIKTEEKEKQLEKDEEVTKNAATNEALSKDSSV